jgi:hypothetical protein
MRFENSMREQVWVRYFYPSGSTHEVTRHRAALAPHAEPPGRLADGFDFAVLTAVTTWANVDEPVLRWISTLPPIFDPNAGPRLALPTVTPQPVAEPALSGLDSYEVDESLKRLSSAGFIDGKRHGHSQGCEWRELRLTAKGLQLVDQWPNFDQAASAVGMQLALSLLADDATDSETKSAVKRSAGAVGNLADAILKGTLSGVATEVGRDAGGS